MLNYRFSFDDFEDDRIWYNNAEFFGGTQKELMSIDVVP